MNPEPIKIGTTYIPRSLEFRNTVIINIHSEIEELVQDQNGNVTRLGSYLQGPYHIRLEPRYFTQSHIFQQLLHQFHISENQLCQILSQRIAHDCLLLRRPHEPFLLFVHVELFRQHLTMLPPFVTSPSRAVSDHVLQRLVDEQRVESLNLKEEEEISCSICMENLSESSHDEKIIRMPSCLHLFHQGCIFEWLKLQNSCPLCRRVLYEDEDVTETP